MRPDVGRHRTILAARTRSDPARLRHRLVSRGLHDEAAHVLFMRLQILDGQEQFLTDGLMQFGTVYGHGTYLGPGFTADYLHRMALLMNATYGGDEAARERTRRELQANRYDPETGTLTWTVGLVSAFDEIRKRFGDLRHDAARPLL